MKYRIVVFSAVFAILNISCLAFASAQITETKLLAGDGEPSDFFGGAVSISGNYALVGAIQHDGNVSNSGAAYVFHFDGSGWVQQAKLIASDGAWGDGFGTSVSLTTDYALVGACCDDAGSGSAYIFQYDGTNWVEQTKLVGHDGPPFSHFGGAVSISGERALVGATLDRRGVILPGAAYIFQYDGSNWVEQAKLFASDGAENDHFGGEVSLSGDYALIGAYDDDDLATDCGSAYVFHFNGSDWEEQAKLLPSDCGEYDSFGSRLSISGEYALVSAYGNDEIGTDAGAAFIFHFNGSMWTELTKLTASDGLEDDSFGISVSLSGDYALVGASNQYTTGNDAAYIFRNQGSNWTEQTKLTSSDGIDNNGFAVSVSLSGDYALVGSKYDDENGSAAGAAYVYTATPACSKVSQFQARCRPGGLIKARVTMADASHAGKVIEISIDEVPYQVVIDATGRGQLSQGGFSSGQHTAELTNPGQCFDPIVVTCRTSLDEEASDDWDDELVSEIPTETTLLGNYPNPFNPSTTIRYTLSVDSPVSIRVYNMLGQEVATLVDGFQKAGEQSVVWQGTNNFGQTVASGLYIYRLQAGNTIMTEKMLFTK